MRVYRYGLRPPTQNAEIVRSSIRGAWEFRNKLVEISKIHRDARRSAESAYAELPLLMEATVLSGRAVKSAEKKGKEWQAREHSNKLPGDVRQLIASRTEQHIANKCKLAQLRKKMSEDAALIAARDSCGEEKNARMHDARKERRCAWGTGGLVERAMEESAKMPLWDKFAEEQDPDCPRWKGEGSIGVQINGGASLEEVFGAHTFIHIDPVSKLAWSAPTRGERKRASRTVLSLRVASDGKEPVWACWPMIMHRAIPDGAVVKSAAVHVFKVGPHEKWYVTITVDDRCCRRIQPKTHGAIAIDVGWRQFDNELRACTWYDGKDTGELRLPGAVVPYSGVKRHRYNVADVGAALRYPDDLKSIRSKNLTAALTALTKGLAQLTLPKWMLMRTVKHTEDCPTQPQALAHIQQWRSQARLSMLCQHWRDNRFAGDTCAYEELEVWRKQDRHLWTWETAQRAKSLGRRKDIYRVFAAKLADRYSTLILEDFDLPPIIKRKKAGEGHHAQQPAHNRVLVATYTLRDALKNAFTVRGGTVRKVPPQFTTMTCNVCGSVEEFDAAGKVKHTCKNGHTWDQDTNASINLWELGTAASYRAKEEKIKPPKRERVAALRAAKLERMTKALDCAEGQTA